MIKLTAKIFVKHFSDYSREVRIGHIGGDDFIAICELPVPEYILENICREFDNQRMEFFSLQHAESGFYPAVNRQGDLVDTPLVSLSLAVVTDANFNFSPHPGRLSEIAAHLKKKIKSNNSEDPKSDYLAERRTYQD